MSYRLLCSVDNDNNNCNESNELNLLITPPCSDMYKTHTCNTSEEVIAR